MRKKRNEEAKKPVLIAVLCVIGAAALAGIVFSLYRQELPEKVMADGVPQAEENIVVEWTVPEDEIEEPGIQKSEPAVTPTAEPEMIIAVDLSTPVPEEAGLEQKNQADPVREDAGKPSGPPAGIKEQQEQKPAVKPENTLIPDVKPTVAPAQDNKPQHGQIRDGKIYIEGFGWVDYNGGETVGIPADGIYENGNKVGSMD